MLFYADEDFPLPLIIELRRWGHDVLTVQENARQGDTDLEVLVTAHSFNRAVLTYNR